MGAGRCGILFVAVVGKLRAARTGLLRTLDTAGEHMRFKIGEFPVVDPAHIEAAGWRRAASIEETVFLNRAMLVMLAASIVAVPLWDHVMPGSISFDPLVERPIAVTAYALLWLVALFGAHELLHLAVHPGAGTSPRSVLGFLPRRLVFYAVWLEPTTRGRFLAMCLAPFAVLSIVPLIVAMLGAPVPVELAWVSATNASMSGADIYFACRMVRQGRLSQPVWFSGWVMFVPEADETSASRRLLNP